LIIFKADFACCFMLRLLSSTLLFGLCKVVREHGPPLKLLLLHPSNKEITASSLLLDSDRVLSDDDASLRERYGLRTKGAAYLFRPDQHVAARWIALDAVRLQTALDQIRRPSLLMS